MRDLFSHILGERRAAATHEPKLGYVGMLGADLADSRCLRDRGGGAPFAATFALCGLGPAGKVAVVADPAFLCTTTALDRAA